MAKEIDILNDKGFVLNKFRDLGEALALFVNAYRLLIGGAEEFGRIPLAHREEVEAAIARADNLGAVVDEIIQYIDCNLDLFFLFIELEKIKDGIKDIKGLKAIIQSTGVREKSAADNLAAELAGLPNFENLAGLPGLTSVETEATAEAETGAAEELETEASELEREIEREIADNIDIITFGELGEET